MIGIRILRPGGPGRGITQRLASVAAVVLAMLGLVVPAAGTGLAASEQCITHNQAGGRDTVHAAGSADYRISAGFSFSEAEPAGQHRFALLARYKTAGTHYAAEVRADGRLLLLRRELGHTRVLGEAWVSVGGDDVLPPGAPPDQFWFRLALDVRGDRPGDPTSPLNMAVTYNGQPAPLILARDAQPLQGDFNGFQVGHATGQAEREIRTCVVDLREQPAPRFSGKPPGSTALLVYPRPLLSDRASEEERLYKLVHTVLDNVGVGYHAISAEAMLEGDGATGWWTRPYLDQFNVVILTTHANRGGAVDQDTLSSWVNQRGGRLVMLDHHLETYAPAFLTAALGGKRGDASSWATSLIVAQDAHFITRWQDVDNADYEWDGAAHFWKRPVPAFPFTVQKRGEVETLAFWDARAGGHAAVLARRAPGGGRVVAWPLSLELFAPPDYLPADECARQGGSSTLGILPLDCDAPPWSAANRFRDAGASDLLWRSVVWAARKPFPLLRMPAWYTAINDHAGTFNRPADDWERLDRWIDPPSGQPRRAWKAYVPLAANNGDPGALGPGGEPCWEPLEPEEARGLASRAERGLLTAAPHSVDDDVNVRCPGQDPVSDREQLYLHYDGAEFTPATLDCKFSGVSADGPCPLPAPPTRPGIPTPIPTSPPVDDVLAAGPLAWSAVVFPHQGRFGENAVPYVRAHLARGGDDATEEYVLNWARWNHAPAPGGDVTATDDAWPNAWPFLEPVYLFRAGFMDEAGRGESPQIQGRKRTFSGGLFHDIRGPLDATGHFLAGYTGARSLPREAGKELAHRLRRAFRAGVSPKLNFGDRELHELRPDEIDTMLNETERAVLADGRWGAEPRLLDDILRLRRNLYVARLERWVGMSNIRLCAALNPDGTNALDPAHAAGLRLEVYYDAGSADATPREVWVPFWQGECTTFRVAG